MNETNPSMFGIDIAILKQVALFIFLALFLLLVIKLLLTRKGAYEKRKQIPLEDQKVMEPRNEDDEHANSADVTQGDQDP
jgi:hypothetical protein